ncbi:MAG TPA: hemerythrin domain-containing protein [Polyangiaceae bacterium]
MSTDGFLSLLETHDHLDELFSLHQQSVLVMHWPLAIELLSAYRSQLVLHVDQEEHRLLPLFERAGPVDRAPVALFTGQHKKMFSLLDRIVSQLGTTHQSEDARRAAIEILDLETAFKHLVEHHDGAEVSYFYPTLQRMASDHETATLVQTCWEEWNRARAALVSVVARAQQELEATSSRSRS